MSRLNLLPCDEHEPDGDVCCPECISLPTSTETAIASHEGPAVERKEKPAPVSQSSTPGLSTTEGGPSPLSHKKPVLLDLFCCAGGAAKGYQRAGFKVVGVDIQMQPNYCGDEFYIADAVALMESFVRSGIAGVNLGLYQFDAIHASPPCQHYLALGAVNKARGREYDHPDLVAATRELVRATGLPYVIENVVGAPLENPVQLCGSSFGLAVRRHRLFETSFPVMAPPCAHHLQTEAKYPTNWRPNGEKRLATCVQVYGNAAGTDLWPEAMGIDWMTTPELAEAIPPAYTEHIGHYLMAAVREGAKAA